MSRSAQQPTDYDLPITKNYMFGAVDFGIADHCQRAGREQAAQIAIASFADTAEPVFAATRVLLRHKPDPGRKIPP